MNRSWMVIAAVAALAATGHTPTQKLQAATGYQDLTRTMLATDPNRDPNWDWTQDVTYTLVTTTQTYEHVRLPYYSGSGPAAAALNVPDGRDIRREDGWRLLLRDFGPGAEQAFFILYNRNRGILRVFYYHSNAIYSHAVGTLRFQDPDPAESAAHMTLDDQTDRYVSNYDPERALVSVGAMGTGWCYLDFPVTGFDPTVHLKADPSFVIQITGVTSTEVVLSGEIDLTQRTASTQRKGGDGFQATDVLGFYKHVAQRYKDVNDARETFEKMAKLDPDEKWADFILNTIGNLGNQKWLSALGPVGGIVELAIGGGSGKQPAPLIYDGTLSLNGELTTEAPLYQITMRVPGSRHLDPVDQQLNVLPLYDLPLGIFNVAEAPQYDLYKYQTIYDWTKNSWTGTTVSAITKPLIVEANLHVFGTVTVKANHIIAGGWLAGPYRSVSTFNSSNVSNGYIADGFDDPFAFNFNTSVGAARLAVQATLTPLDAPPDAEPVTVIKTYSPPKTMKAWPPPAFTSVPRRPARPSSLVATPGPSGGIDLRWLDNAGNETSFVVEEIVFAYPTNMIVNVATLPAGTTSYHVSGGIPGTRYFRVRATNAAGSSPSSNQAASVAGGCSVVFRCF
jgi:hypothetical protein